jgi:glycosyltransferase involved in cell wall biosynthesis
MNIDTAATNNVSPQFSIVCPVFNSKEWIHKTLDTVLDQTFRPFELIIVDDGSSDDTPALVVQYLQLKNPIFPCTILRGEHRGPGAARNSGIRAARGDWIAFLDSDDLWAPNKLERVAHAIAKTSDANFFCHHEELAKLDGQRVALNYAGHYNSNRPLPVQLYQRNLFSTSAVVCRRIILLEHGLFDESLMSAQDYELWLRLSSRLRVAFVQERLGLYIERQGNITNGSWLQRMRNELLIAWRHRKLVPATDLAIRLLRIVASYHKQALARRLKHYHNRST